MTAYVDDMGMQATVQNGSRQVTGKWCHLYADTHDELMAVAEKAGLNPKWIQHLGTPDEHFDVTGKKIPAVVRAGAQPVSWRFTGQFFAQRNGRAGTAENAPEAPGAEEHEQPRAGRQGPAERPVRHRWAETDREGQKVCLRDGCGMGAEQRWNPATRRPVVIYSKDGQRVVSERVPPCGSELAADVSPEEARHLATAADRKAGEAYKAGDLDRAFRLLTDARCLDPGRSQTWDEREKRLTAKPDQSRQSEPDEVPADPAVIEAETQKWAEWNAGLPKGLSGPEWHRCPEHGVNAQGERARQAAAEQAAKQREGAV